MEKFVLIKLLIKVIPSSQNIPLNPGGHMHEDSLCILYPPFKHFFNELFVCVLFVGSLAKWEVNIIITDRINNSL